MRVVYRCGRNKILRRCCYRQQKKVNGGTKQSRMYCTNRSSMIVAFNFHRENRESENTTQDGRNLPTNCFVSGFAFFCSEEKGESRFCLFLFLRPRDGFEIKIRGKRERPRQKVKKSAHSIFSVAMVVKKNQPQKIASNRYVEEF